ncbi:MAG TPA: hypothetical protein VJZ32_10100 [Candidatus Bathyarchaeia archaeon]|nr:hypothetical protein [Candidatus Bathyarchaeia archaeon]
MDAKRAQRLEVILRYSAGIIFAVLALSGFQTSASTAAMQDLGTSLYHDPVDVSVLWFQSQACMVLPPDNYITNCTTIPSIGATVALTALLAVVLVAYMIVRKRKTALSPQAGSTSRL